jgi:hypothetical protein
MDRENAAGDLLQRRLLLGLLWLCVLRFKPLLVLLLLLLQALNCT